MTYKYDPLASGWRKYFNIYDELVSLAFVINDNGRVVESNQYKAFGVKDYAYKERLQATGYIGKEKDNEMNLAEYGFRKYDSDLGRFLCPDAMWEK